jgi:hypothetical protein
MSSTWAEIHITRFCLLFHISFSLQLVDDGIARGNDALTLLENRSTYTLFIHELHRVS